MGCVNSTNDINDLHPNTFQVMNVDDDGQLVCPGELELSETEMILYQKGKSVTRWPLAYIRRYGYESDLFSFESGRRCPTGAGIFAFKCRRAQQLFNLLHQHIAIQRSQSGDLINHPSNDFQLPLMTSGPTVPIRPAVQTSDASYLEPLTTPRPPMSRTHSVGFTRLNSISSNGPTSPSNVTPPLMISPEPAPENNNNKRSSLTLQTQRAYINTFIPTETEASTTSCQAYMNVEAPGSPSPSITSDNQLIPTEQGPAPLYMNVTPGDVLPPTQSSGSSSPQINSDPITAVVYLPTDLPLSCNPLPLVDEQEEDPVHCYANLETDEIEGLRNIIMTSDNTHVVPQTPLGVTKEVVYAILDLETSKDDNFSSNIPNAGAAPPESPKKPTKGYTVIDFNKTVAVSQIVKQNQDLNSEGSRKTRHNSTISELGQISSRHSSSLSD